MSATVLLVVLLVVVAWLVAASMAVRSVSRIWLRHWVERRLHGAEVAELYLERPQRLLLAAGTGVALAVFVGGTVLGATSTSATRLIEKVLVAALVVLLFGQIAPRAVSRRFAISLVPVLLPVLRAIDAVLSPVQQLFRRIAGRGAGGGTIEEERDSIEELLREGALEGVGEQDEIAIITGVVEFGQKTVGEIMTPRDEIFAVDRATPPVDMALQIAAAGYSRVPVYEEALDRVVGMVHVFDVIKARGETVPPLREIASAAPTTPISELLFEMLRRRRHLAVVREEGGRTVGIVTLEDLLEELVGDIRDEHDEPSTPQPTGTA